VSAGDVVVLCASILVAIAALVLLVVSVILAGQVRRLDRAITTLESETTPLVGEARNTLEYASSEMARVDSVLEGTQSVTNTVDSASRLAQRAFANPVVKLLAYRAGTASGLRRLRQPAQSGSRRRP
jgi:predicted PurR-regulated permease PerM